jgi:hypothetical protein
MTLSREELIKRRASITKGMRIVADCPIRTPYTPSHAPESALDEAIGRMRKARELAGEIAAALRQQRR